MTSLTDRRTSPNPSALPLAWKGSARPDLQPRSAPALRSAQRRRPAAGGSIARACPRNESVTVGAPAMFSARTMPIAEATCASVSLAVTSPIATPPARWSPYGRRSRRCRAGREAPRPSPCRDPGSSADADRHRACSAWIACARPARPPRRVVGTAGLDHLDLRTGQHLMPRLVKAFAAPCSPPRPPRGDTREHLDQRHLDAVDIPDRGQFSTRWRRRQSHHRLRPAACLEDRFPVRHAAVAVGVTPGMLTARRPSPHDILALQTVFGPVLSPDTSIVCRLR